ncbi:hypothetical protein [Streptomyces sp. NPDC051569]|uniref:hypothetical protein n=1 Tax=Streptomyces sp. NPDC051569 TaxID=3365661 RepID=UPI003792C400
MSYGDDHGYGSDPGRTDDSYGGSGQTRTRLPDGRSGDGYGGPRRPARSSRSLITVVGVVVLLVAAIAFANRGGGDDHATGGGAKGATSGPGAAPTTATGVKPVTGGTGTIPSGFAQDEQGAASAAANYAVALGSDGMYEKEQRRAIVSAVFAPDVAPAHEDALDKVYSSASFLSGIGLTVDGKAPVGTTFVSRTNPVGTKVEKFSATSASVAVWSSALFGLSGEGSTNPVSESWYTNTFALKWVDGDWKVTDFTQKEGPVPVGRDQAASSAQEMADAVQEFGGFTYAR